MAAMTTVLTEFSTNGNSRTYELPGHTVFDPKICIQKRRVPSGNQTVAEDTITVLQSTVDADGSVLPQKVSFEVKVRRPIDGQSVDLTELLAVFRDIVAGDEFGDVVNTQGFLV